MKIETSVPHSLSQSILLHLLPGLLIGLFYFLVAPLVVRAGFPSVVALVLAGCVILVPVELGILYTRAKSSSQAGIWTDIIGYRQSISLNQYLIWTLIIFVASGTLMTVMTPVTEGMQSLFSWLPDVYHLQMGLNGKFSPNALIVTYLGFFLVLTLAAPIVEELYFRGYLLPRMPDLQGWSPVVHSLLFALYHTWTPWMVLTRTLGVLPLIYIVRWKQNIYLGIIAHCLLNAIDVIIGVAFFLSLV